MKYWERAVKTWPTAYGDLFWFATHGNGGKARQDYLNLEDQLFGECQLLLEAAGTPTRMHPSSDRWHVEFATGNFDQMLAANRKAKMLQRRRAIWLICVVWLFREIGKYHWNSAEILGILKTCQIKVAIFKNNSVPTFFSNIFCPQQFINAGNRLAQRNNKKHINMKNCCSASAAKRLAKIRLHFLFLWTCTQRKKFKRAKV